MAICGVSLEGSSPDWGQSGVCEVLRPHPPTAAYLECALCSKSNHLCNALNDEDLLKSIWNLDFLPSASAHPSQFQWFKEAWCFGHHGRSSILEKTKGWNVSKVSALYSKQGTAFSPRRLIKSQAAHKRPPPKLTIFSNALLTALANQVGHMPQPRVGKLSSMATTDPQNKCQL